MNVPLKVHDTAYLTSPVAAAVSRVTLHPWCQNVPSDTLIRPRGAPLARGMQNAMSWVRHTTPDFRHGLLVHAVQKHQDGRPEEPALTTLKQYVSQHTTLFCVPLDAPQVAAQRSYVVIVHLDDKYRVPKWVWHRLASTLLYESSVVGDPPSPLTPPARPGGISA
jgi:hypothetical protein